MPDRLTRERPGRTTVDAQALLGLLPQPSLRVVDVRPLAAYNGWRLGSERRGGHIPDAVAFPVGWLESVESSELQVLASDKGLLRPGPVVVYGHGVDDATAFAEQLEAWGQGEVVVYPAGWTDWVADPDRPAEALPRFESLVHPSWLAALQAGSAPDHAPVGEWLLFHVNFGVPEEYLDSHLPGALYLDTNRLEARETWNRRTPEEIGDCLKGLGITRDTTVLLYGRDTEGQADEKWPGRRAGQIAATRAALILRYAGVDDVRVLDGGYDAWVRAGHPLETIIREPSPVDEHGLRIPERPELLVDLPEAKEILADREGAALVSVRTWEEHIGAISGYNYIGPAGRIVGDVWGNCGSDAYHMQHYRTVDNTMRPYPEIAANWAAAGITADKWVAFYCGTGWRAAETWFYAYLMGWERIAVYDGGWFEWSQDPLNNPVAVGLPEATQDAATAI
jgi:thiosulfate/3-mercaptopyruvate sulfurtransferase